MPSQPIKETSGGGIRRSLLLSAVIMLLPLLLLFGQNLVDRQRALESLHLQQFLLQWVTPLYRTLDLATQYRGLRDISKQHPGHYDFAEEHLDMLEQQVSEQIDHLRELHWQLPQESPQSREVLQQLERIDTLWLQQQSDAFEFVEYSNLITHLNSVIANLVPNPTSWQYILQRSIPTFREVLAQLRGAGSGYLAYHAASNAPAPLQEGDPRLQRIERLMWDSQNQFIQLRNALGHEKEQLDEQMLSILIELVSETQEVRDLVEWEILDSATISYHPESFFEEASQPIYLLHQLVTNILQELEQAVQQQIRQQERERITLVFLVLTALFLSLFLAYHNLRHQIRGLKYAIGQLRHIGHGDFDQPIRTLKGRGEIQTLLNSIQQTQTQLKQLYTELESAQLFSESLTSSMGDGVYALDSQGKLIFINHAAETLLGWDSEALQSRNFHNTVHAEQPDGHHIDIQECPMSQAHARGERYFSELNWFKQRSGAFLPVELSVAPLVSMGHIRGSVAVFRDISERLELDNKLRQALKDAKQASQAKDEFLASMSYELRTPLTAILGNCELLGELKQSTESHELIEAIEHSGRRQLALVNDILDLSKIESGKFTIESRPYNLDALVQEMRMMFALRIRDAGLQFKVEQQARFNHYLIGDSPRCGQILINLIGNATKFTETGTISLTVLQQSQEIHFVVEDTGIGMPPEVLQRLFQRFEQADNSISRRFGGSGLGLFISFQLAQLMGGTIEVESEQNKGSRFTLKLPLQLGEPLPAVNKKKTESIQSAQTKLEGSILVAEDTPELQLLERRILESIGLQVTTAENGIEAVAAARENRFDLILMDMQMPEMDGIEATREIRKFNQKIPVIALTANVLQQHRDAFNEAGGSDFVGKPINRTELTETLGRFLR